MKIINYILLCLFLTPFIIIVGLYLTPFIIIVGLFLTLFIIIVGLYFLATIYLPIHMLCEYRSSKKDKK